MPGRLVGQRRGDHHDVAAPQQLVELVEAEAARRSARPPLRARDGAGWPGWTCRTAPADARSRSRCCRSRRSRPSGRPARVPRSGCQVRSRCSSSSWGRRRAMARHIITTYSAIGRLKTPRALVTVSPRSRTAGVATRSTPAENEWIHSSRGARPMTWSRTEAGTPPRSSTRAAPSAASASSWTRPSREMATTRAPGTASIWATCSARQRGPEDRRGQDDQRLACSGARSPRCGSVHAGDPARRRADLVQGRQRLRALPDAVHEGPVARRQ